MDFSSFNNVRDYLLITDVHEACFFLHLVVILITHFHEIYNTINTSKVLKIIISF